LKQIHGDIGPFGAEFSEAGCMDEPLGGELKVTVIQILTIEGAECENLTWRGVGLEVGGEVRARFFFECVGIVFYHFIGDVDCVTLVEGGKGTTLRFEFLKHGI
jgi:hypothetical protein